MGEVVSLLTLVAKDLLLFSAIEALGTSFGTLEVAASGQDRISRGILLSRIVELAFLTNRTIFLSVQQSALFTVEVLAFHTSVAGLIVD